MRDTIATTARPLLERGSLTLDDWEALGELSPECELIDGELREVSPTDITHERVFVLLVRRLGQFVEDHALGIVIGSRHGLRISTRRGIEPDLMWIPADQMHRLRGAVFRGVPRLVVEVLSRGSITRDRRERPRDLATIGVPFYWIVDPQRRVIEEYALREGEYALASRAQGDVTWSSTAAEGFALPLGELWLRVPSAE